MGAAGLTPLVISAGCGDDGSSSPPLPELPDYSWGGEPGSSDLFEHGVASGDPLVEGVVIWTRISADDAVDAAVKQEPSDDPLEVWWEVALDEAFAMRVAQGTFTTSVDRDFTVKVDVSGLVWGRNYY